MLFTDLTNFAFVYELLISAILKTMLAQGKSLSYYLNYSCCLALA